MGRLQKIAHRFSRSRIPRRVADTPQPPVSIPRMLSIILPVVAIASALLSSGVYSGNADLWRSQSIYQVLFDPKEAYHR